MNICFNRFSPISQLRFWSLMVLVVSLPGVLFCIYAYHKIYHAYVKFPLGEEQEEGKMKGWESCSDMGSASTYMQPPSFKRKRNNSSPIYSNATAPPLYVVKRLNSKKDEKSEKDRKSKNYDGPRHRKRHGLNEEEKKDLMEKRKSSTTDNNFTSDEMRTGRRWQWSDHT